MILIPLIAFLSVINSSDTATMEFLKVKNDSKATVEIIWEQAPNGVPYPIMKKYTPQVGDPYVQEIRHPDFDNPVLDKNGNARRYPYIEPERRFMKVTIETKEQLRTALKNDWIARAHPGGFGLPGLLGLITGFFVLAGLVIKKVMKGKKP